MLAQVARPCRAITSVAHARTRVPFTRASSAGLAGKRVIGCLRSVATSFMTPRQTEQRSGPEGPRSRVPGGIAKGGWASSPPWLAGEGERRVARRHEWLAAVRCWRRRGHGMPCRYENGEAVRNGRRAPHRSIPTRSVGTINVGRYDGSTRCSYVAFRRAVRYSAQVIGSYFGASPGITSRGSTMESGFTSRKKAME